jgi:hypothetical protein
LCFFCQNPYVKDPFRISTEQQPDLLLSADHEMSRVQGVTVSETSMTFRRIEQFFASSLGSAVHQIKMQSGAGIVATAFAGNGTCSFSFCDFVAGGLLSKHSGGHPAHALDLGR